MSGIISGSIIGASQIVTDGLIFYLDAANPTSYPGSGTNFFNLGSNLYNSGSLQGSTTYTSSNNGSMLFDGDGDYISIPAINSPKFASQFTLNFWVKPTNVGSVGNTGYVGFICKIGGYNFNTNRFLLANSFGRFLFQMIPQDLSPELSVTSLRFNSIQNQISMCSLTYNSFTSSSTFYLNGINRGSYTTISGSMATGSVVSTIGWGANIEAYYFSGSMYSIQIYDRALSASEIRQNYNAHYRRIVGNDNIKP